MNLHGVEVRMLRWTFRIAVLILALAMAAPASAQERRILESGGIGKVRIGMSISRAERALGARLRSFIPAYGKGCWLAVRADGIDAGLSYMVKRARITRIDVDTPRSGTAPMISTAKGIGVGSTQAEVERAYGSAVIVAPAPYGHSDGDRWLTVESTPTRGIVLSISDGKVVSLWSGRRSSIAYSEACS